MDVKELIYKYAIKNAYEHGHAREKAVLGKVIAENPKLKNKIKELIPLIKEIVAYVNNLNRKEIENEYKKYTYIKKHVKEKKELPDFGLKKVVVRFAPNPNGPLHLGHARAAILNDEYAKRFKGKFILRFEDTNPYKIYYRDKNDNGYKLILEDLEYLNVNIDSIVYQSDRLHIYYEHAEKLIEKGLAYVCKCDQNTFKELRKKGKACKHREQSVEKNLREFEKMFKNYKEGEAVLRLKTDLNHPDPSIRDFPIMRICEKKHPRVNSRVFPLMNFAVAIDDHLLGLTLVLRGKDHIVNTEKQRYIFKYFGWKEPIYVHYGLLKIEDGETISTSEIREKIEKKLLIGWDDPRLLTLRALKRKGIKPEAIRKFVLELGVKESDIKVSLKTLYNYNRELIDKEANRYFFVVNPVKVFIENPPSKTYKVRLHPKEKRGFRNLKVGNVVYISYDDYRKIKEGDEIRLMEAVNIKIVEKKPNEAVALFLNESLDYAMKKNLTLIHWVPEKCIDAEVLKAKNNELVYEKGKVEMNILNENVGNIIQFERYGFIKIEEKHRDHIKCIYMHD